MKLRKLIVPFLAALAMSGAASAAVLTGASGSMANLVTDYSAPGLVAFDLDWKDSSATRLDFMIEEADLLGPLRLNAIIRNLTGEGFRQFTFSLDGIAFSNDGSVTPAFGTVGKTTWNSASAGIDFSAPEWAEFHLGNPTGLDNNSDWLLNTADLRAGDAFSITASVPEPSTISLMLSALAMFGFLAAKQRHKR